MSAINCQKCKSFPNKTPYNPPSQPDGTESGGYYYAGDICAIHESVSTPIYRLLLGMDPPSQAARSRSTWGTAASVSKKGTRKPKGARPCVVLNTTPRKPGSRHVGATVCLLASLGGESRIRALPTVLRVFSFPLSPHVQAEPGVSHYHTSPDWQEENMWIIGLPFETKSEIKWLWRDRIPGTGTSSAFHMSVVDVAELKQLCERRLLEWQKHCLDDKMHAQKAFVEYQAFSNPAAERFKEKSQREAGRSKSPGGRQSTDQKRKPLHRKIFGAFGKQSDEKATAPTTPVSALAHANLQASTSAAADQRAPSPAVTTASATSVASKPKSSTSSPRLGVLGRLLRSKSKSTLGGDA